VRRLDQALDRLQRFLEATDRLPWALLVFSVGVITAVAVGVVRGYSFETAVSNALAVLLIFAAAATLKWAFTRRRHAR
jgi:hypothetical protein